MVGPDPRADGNVVTIRRRVRYQHEGALHHLPQTHGYPVVTNRAGHVKVQVIGI